MSQFSRKEIFSTLRQLLEKDVQEFSSLYEVFEDSIQMFRFLGQVKDSFGVEMGMLELATAQNIGDLIDKIAEKCGGEAEVEKRVPLSPMQQSYVLGREENFHGAKNSTHLYFEIKHSMDIDRAEKCFKTLIERHEALRAYVEGEEACILSKEIANKFKIQKESVPDSELNAFLEKKRLQKQTECNDIHTWPLFEVVNVSSESQNIAAVDLELMFVDGMSAQALAREFIHLYAGNDLPEGIDQNPQFIEWLKGRSNPEKRSADQKFWEAKEDSLPAAPRLPDTGNENSAANICNRVLYKFSVESSKNLEIAARKFGVTSSVILFYLYLKTLARFSESGNFSVNITVLNRPYGLEGMDTIVGDYTSNVLFGFDEKEFSGKSTEQILQTIRNQMYESIDHSAYEGVEVIRDLIRKRKVDAENPMPIVFTSMLFGKLPPVPKDIEIHYCQSQTSQVSIDNQICKTHDGCILISWDYLEKIFPNDIIREMFRYYTEGLEAFAENGSFQIAEPGFVQKIKTYNATEKNFSVEHPIDLFRKMVEVFPSKVAVRDSAASMTYAELDDSVRKAMSELKKAGVCSGDFVAVLSQKNIATVVTILAVMGIGAAYIPVDFAWPADRKEYILKNSNCKLLADPQKIAQSQSKDRAEYTPNPNLDATAYVIYTSGSTGVPKGVLISYAAVVNTLLDINERMSIDSTTTVLGLSSYCFDLSVYDIFGTFIAGGTLDIAKDIRETEEIRSFVKSGTNLLWNSVPAGMELFIDSLDEDEIYPELKTVLLSGDWISVHLPEKIRHHFPAATIYSLGGATEASIWSIYFPIGSIDPKWQSIPYGYPLANQTIYVMNDRLELCPPEVKGEICIGGIGVAQGYANSPEKTSAAFIDHPKFGRIYKTGDYGRFSSEGYVVFLGRKDSQVKIGGYRIELGEIEQRINAIASVESAVVILDSNKKILAFYTGKELSKESFRKELSQFLPTYMIPHRFVHLEKIPLSSNGKLDRKALAERDNALSENEKREQTIATETQSAVFAIWENVLGTQNMDTAKDFFELGGDSIRAQRIAQQVEKKFGLRVPFVSILNAHSAREFAEDIENKLMLASNAEKPVAQTTVTESAKEKEFPMTGVQIAYLNGRNESFELGKYNAHYYFEIDFAYSVAELETAIRKVVRKYDAFRAIFLPNGMQKVLTNVPDYKVEVVRSAYESLESEALRIRNELSHHIYKHDLWPLFTFKVLESGSRKILFVSFDLMVCDGDSMQLFFSDLGKILRHQNFEERIGYSYERYLRDLSKAKDASRYEEDKAYWHSRIPTFPEFPHVPLAKKISDCTEYSMTRKQAVIARKTWERFKDVAREHRISPSALLCTIYAKVLSRWSNQTELMLNLTAFERKPFHKDVEKIIGDFTKLLPLQLSTKEPDLWKAAGDTQNRIMDGLEHLSYDGTEIMRELAKSRGQFGKAILPVVFTCVLFDAPENYYEALGKMRYAISQTPQVFIDNQIVEMGQKLYITWDVVKELFEPVIIDQIFADFVENIRYVAIGETDMIFPEVQAAWKRYNPAVGLAPSKTLHGLVEESMAKFQGRTAVVGKGKSLTYAELDALSNRIANYLRSCGVSVGNRVAVLGERLPETIASILGILKSGAAYVPIDVSYPKERIDFIMQDAGCKILLKKELIDSDEIQNASSAPLPQTNDPKSEAYIIYTSGSTGTPKGVIMAHGPTANTIIDVNERIGLSEKDSLIGISSICFDLSVYDIFGTLSRGAKLALVSDPRDMSEVVKILDEEKISVWNSVPILFSMAMKHRISAAANLSISLRKVLLSGDRIPLDICETVHKAACSADLISLGGATEAAIWSIIYPFNEVRPEWDCIPYGYPMKNQTFYVLDQDLKLCPPEVQGDLFIGGVGLANGYHNDPEKTAKAFILHPQLGRIYRTGDLGKLKTEGFIEFLGRSDTQIKLNGFRIELGEIEAALMRTGKIKNAVAALKEIPGSGKQIIAYVLGANFPDAENVLKSEIAKRLTAYMIPSRIVNLPSFPLSSNGKVDKRALPVPEVVQATKAKSSEPMTKAEEDVLRIWQGVFENPNITLEDDFYSLGGDSIVLMKLIDSLTVELQKTASIDQILQAKNIKEFSAML